MTAKVACGHPYPDIYDPLTPYPLFKLHPLFAAGQLTDAKGQPVAWEQLRGKSVALYFADYSKPRCRTFLPVLLNLYRTLNENGEGQKVEIIFVSLDKSAKEFEGHREKQPWLALRPDDDLVETLKQHFRVIDPREKLKYGYGPRLGLPALLVIGSDGRLLQELEISDVNPRAALRKWDTVSHRF